MCAVMAYPCSGPRRAKTVSTRSGKDPCSVSGRVGIHSSLSKRAHYASMGPSMSTEAKFSRSLLCSREGFFHRAGTVGSPFGVDRYRVVGRKLRTCGAVVWRSEVVGDG